jgi:bacterioferritin-associated ferredoxin
MRAVILRAEALVVAVVALVDSESMRSLGALIQQLGIGPSVGRCVELLRDAIQGLQQRVAELAAALADKDAAAGLLGLLRPLVRGMARLIHASSSELAGLGLEADAAVLGPVRGLVQAGGCWLERGEAVLLRLPQQQEIDGLRGAIDDLSAAFDRLIAALRSPSTPNKAAIA